MKKLLILVPFLLALAIIKSPAPSSGGSYGGGSSSTSTPVTNILDSSDLVADTIYTNTSGSNLLVSVSFTNGSLSTFTAQGWIYVDQKSDGVWETKKHMFMSGSTSAIDYGNDWSWSVNPGGRYVITNLDGMIVQAGSCQRVYSPAAQVVVSGVASAVPASTDIMAGNGSGALVGTGITAASVVTTNLLTTNTVYQLGYFTNYAGNIFVTNTFSSLTNAVAGTYVPVSPIGTLAAWSNIVSGTLLVSNIYYNGSSNCWAFTNSGVIYFYSKAVNAAGYPDGSANTTWTTLSGGTVRPVASWFKFYTNIYNPQTVTRALNPFLLTNYNQEIRVELWGNDTTGLPGVSPFATWEGAVNAGYSNSIYIGEGTFIEDSRNPFYSSTSLQLASGCNLIGKGDGITILAIYGNTNTSIFVTTSNIIKDLTCETITWRGTIPPKNITVRNVTIGATNLIDNFFFSGNGTNINLYNVHAINCWDFDQGINSGYYNNVVVDCVYMGIPGNTAGGHGILCQGNCDKTINGGIYNVSGFSANTNVLTAEYNNACLMINGPNNRVVLNGPAFNHWDNGTNEYAIWNYTGNTNVTGYCFDNGVLTYVNGTNYTQFRSTGITNFSGNYLQ